MNDQDDLTALTGIKSKGINLNSLSLEEKEGFKKLLKPVYDSWKKKIGEEIFNEAVKTMQEK
jgi:TRAP-type C4-dicarboxylate transport system substrate-binding protein